MNRNIISFLCSSIATSESPGNEQTFRGHSQGHSEVHIKVKLCSVLFWCCRSSLFFVPRLTGTEACLHFGRSGPSETSRVHLQGFDLQSSQIRTFAPESCLIAANMVIGLRSVCHLGCNSRRFVAALCPESLSRAERPNFRLIKSHSIFCLAIICFSPNTEYTHWC